MNDRVLLPPDLAWAAYLISSWWQNPEPPPDIAPDPDAILARLRRNGFPLLTLAPTSAPGRALLETESFCLAIQQDRDKMERQKTAFGEIVAAWRHHGIPALFVKAMGPLPTFPYVSNNLDVLVPQARQDEARQIVRKLGYVELRHIEEPNKFLFRRFHAGAAEPAISAFDLHIHGRLEWHTEFVDSAAVWQRAASAPDLVRSDLPGFPHLGGLALIPAPEDGLLIALAHAAYENKAYKLVELAKFIYASRVLHVDWDRVADGARRRGWLPGLWTILVSFDAWERQIYGQLGQGASSLPAEVLAVAEREMPARLRPAVAARFAGKAKAPVALPFAESKRLFYEKMVADPSQSTAGRAREIWTHTLYGTRVRLRLRSQRPMLIALDGIDGSGKSAQAALLDKALEGAALRHRVVWTRGGSSRLLQPLFALGKALVRKRPLPLPPAVPPSNSGATLPGDALPKGKSSADANPFIRPGAAGPHAAGPHAAGPHAAGWSSVAARETERSPLFKHPVVRTLWPWAIALELGATWQARVRWPLLRGEVVVADRYVDTALVELAARLDRVDVARSGAGRLLRWLAPRPDFSFWLEIPAGIALARKDGDESDKFLAKQALMARACRTNAQDHQRSGSVLPAAAKRVELDATLPTVDLSDRIVTGVLRAYEDRHWTLVNALFCANPRRLER